MTHTRMDGKGRQAGWGVTRREKRGSVADLVRKLSVRGQEFRGEILRKKKGGKGGRGKTKSKSESAPAIKRSRKKFGPTLLKKLLRKWGLSKLRKRNGLCRPAS